MRLLPAVLLLTLPALASAQDVVADSSCTFEDCAIEVNRSIFREQYLRGGEPVPNVGPLGLGLPSLTPLVAESPQALAYVATAQREGRTSAGLTLAGQAVGFLVALDPLGLFSRDVQLAGLVGASSLLVASVPFSLRARRARGRAIEVYNAGLPR